MTSEPGARDPLDEYLSPVSGYQVLIRLRIQNQPGTILMTISDLSSINAEVKVAEADVLRLSAGQAATATLEALPGTTFSGRVVEIGASALPTIGTQAAAREFKVKVRIEGRNGEVRMGELIRLESMGGGRLGVAVRFPK